METQNLAALAAMSNKYGADPAFVLAGGGNTSFKTDTHMWIKGSGTSLATIRPEDFVVIDRVRLSKMWQTEYPLEEAAREAAVLKDTMDARVPGETRRPSVETLLHDLFPQKFVLHAHPTLVNGLTCSQEGEKAMHRLFPDAVWVDACKPGYSLALACKARMDAHRAATGRDAQVVFLGNHGIFYAADTTEQIDVLAQSVMDTLRQNIRRQPDLATVSYDRERMEYLTQALRAAFGIGTVMTFTANSEVLRYDPHTASLSPDHIVYAKAKQLAVSPDADVKDALDAFVASNGYVPRIVFVEGFGMFSCGGNLKEAETAKAVMLDAIQATVYAESFGGVSPMAPHLISFILNWEVERYRSKVSLG